MVVVTGCAATLSRSTAGVRASDARTLRIPSSTGALAALCRKPVYSFDEGRATLDTIARALAASGTPPGPFTVERLPKRASPRLASFAIRRDTAVISIGDTLGGHSLYHELVHAWAARLAPAESRAMVESVFAADRIAEWEPEVSAWASASYLSVINGLADPGGFTTMALSVTANALDTAQAGRLTRLFDATSPIVERAPERGGTQRTVNDALRGIAAAHWRYAGHRVPEGWDAVAERRFILASEVLAYAREGRCVGVALSRRGGAG